MKRSVQAVLAVAALARAGPILFGFEHYGDAPVRIEIAERWAKEPHLWHGFAETYQYGPLHLTLIGALVRLLGDRLFAARLLSLACGLACVWLLHRIADRERGPEAAFWAALGLALSPLHVQASATGASEALFLALLLGAILGALRGDVVLPGVLLGAAGLVRYDGWMYVPLVALVILWRQRSPLRSAACCALAAAPALLWIWLNARWTGDPLAPIHHIDREHAQLARMAMDSAGALWTRLEALVYWPVVVSVVTTPVLGFFALWGTGRTLLRRDPGWDLAAVAWIPALYLTFRAAVLANFHPMARFTLVAATLSLVFAHDALGRFGRSVRALAVAVAVATPVVLAALCWNRSGRIAEWVRPVAPLGSLPPGIVEAAHWMRSNAREQDVVLVDDSVWYLDIPLVFASGLPEEKLLRARWRDDFERRYPRFPPTLAVMVVAGRVADFRQDRFEFRGMPFCAAERYLYAAVYRACATP